MQGSVRTHLAALVALVVLAPVAGAQELARPDARETPAAVAAPAAPSRDAASVAVRAPVAAADATVGEGAVAAAQFGRGETLMIVGGAALLAGLIIGDDAGTVIAVSGAIVGLYGLYVYLGTN
ncbi:MAG TPA: hypothetical protein VFZ11_05665 [Gemmatimonadaceae bacterium]